MGDLFCSKMLLPCPAIIWDQLAAPISMYQQTENFYMHPIAGNPTRSLFLRSIKKMGQLHWLAINLLWAKPHEISILIPPEIFYSSPIKTVTTSLSLK